MLVLVAVLGCFAVSAYTNTEGRVTVAWSDLVVDESIAHTTANGYYTKEYDGTNAVEPNAIKFTDAFLANGYHKPFTGDPDVEIAIADCTLSGKNVNDRVLLTVSFKLVKNGADYTEGFYSAPEAITVPASITPVALTWNGGTINSTLAYKYGTSEYLFKNVDGTNQTLAQYIEATLRPSMDVTGTVDENLVAVWNNVTASGTKDTFLRVTLGANGNYVIDPIPVKLSIAPITVASVDWNIKDSAFVYGDASVYNITATVTDTSGGVWTQRVNYQQKDAEGNWVDVDKISGNVGDYRIYIPYGFSDIVEYDDVNCYKDITIIKAKYKVEMKGITYVGDKDHTSGTNVPKYFVAVGGKGMEIPTDVLSKIIYVDGNGDAFTGAFEYGMTEITAILPVSDNYEFINANNKTITKLNASIWLNRLFIPAGIDLDGIDVIVWGEGLGFDPDLKVEVTKPEMDSNALRGYPLHTEFTLKLSGNVTGNERIILLIPHDAKLFDKNASPLTADDLYVYEAATGKLVKVNEDENYAVTLEDGYYKVVGYNGAAPITFVIAPTYNTPFILSATGIALIVALVLALFAILFVIGLRLRRIAATRRANAPTVVDTEGEKFEGTVVAVDGTVAPIVDIDSLKLPEEEEETVDEEAIERTKLAVEDSLEELTNEAAQIELPREDLSKADQAADALAEKLASDLNDTVEADNGKDAENDAEELKAAIAEAMSQAFNESADATDAIEVVIEEEPVAVETVAVVDEDSDDEDDDDDEDEDESFGFNTAGLKFIDVKAEPEAYNEMVAQERDGLIKIVYRYRRSFTSRMTQSQGNVQEYYSAIKNLLLSYKGIKGRVSWNYEAFNRGRTHVAKINAKTKTLYLYLALNPEELADTKYGAIDMSSKKKYASVPVLMKIKGDRKFKYALELIEKLCGENLTLKQLEALEETDYRMPYKTTEELIEDGVIKMFAAAISMAPDAEKPVVEETTEAAPAEGENA